MCIARHAHPAKSQKNTSILQVCQKIRFKVLTWQSMKNIFVEFLVFQVARPLKTQSPKFWSTFHFPLFLTTVELLLLEK